MSSAFTAMFERTGRAHLDLVAAPAKQAPQTVDTLGVVETLEADLAQCAHLMSTDLRSALAALPAAHAHAVGTDLISAARTSVGFAHNSLPLLAKFPNHNQHLAQHRYFYLVSSLLAEGLDLPCLVCGDAGLLHQVTGCGHTVCTDCLPPAEYSACPTCGRVSDDPIYNRRPNLGRVHRTSAPTVLISRGSATSIAVLREVSKLLATTSSSSAQDLEQLRALLTALPSPVAESLNSDNRAAKAVLVGHLLTHGQTARGIALMTTATDVLRVASEISHQDPHLLETARLNNLRRPLRRALLSALNQAVITTSADNVASDALRNQARFKALGRALHPGEHDTQFPFAYAVFCVVRRTKVTEPLECLAGLPLRGIDHTGDRLSVVSWTGRVENALAAKDIAAALSLLTARPGELFRRLDHLLRISTAKKATTVIDAAAATVADVPAPLLFAVRGSFARRARGAERGAVFPKGGSSRMRLLEDARAALSPATAARIVELVDAELVRRALDPARPLAGKAAVIDASANGVLPPSLGRGASTTRVAIPRGSRLPLQTADLVRLFIHWQDTATERVDLDLAVTVWDEQWNPLATCDYTSYTPAEGLSHSGDFTSAPAPAGASEYVDVDVNRMLAIGGRYAVVTVQSYTNVPFDDLGEAYAGIMVSPDRSDDAGAFDAAAVRQRLDLSGGGRMTMPFIVDLFHGTWMWVDSPIGVTGTHHSVDRHRGAIERQAAALFDLYDSPDRVTLGHLAVNAAIGAGADELVLGDARVLRDGRDDVAFAQAALRAQDTVSSHTPLPVALWAGADSVAAPSSATVVYSVFGDGSTPADLVGTLS
jgi:hypothetical protein